MDPSALDSLDGHLDGHLDADLPPPPGDGVIQTAERLRAARAALAVAMHEGPRCRT